MKTKIVELKDECEKLEERCKAALEKKAEATVDQEGNRFCMCRYEMVKDVIESKNPRFWNKKGTSCLKFVKSKF